MALNSVKNNQAQINFSQLIANLSNSIHRYSKCENLVAVLAVTCTLIILAGAVSLSISTMIVGTAILILSITPTILRWAREDYNRDF